MKDKVNISTGKTGIIWTEITWNPVSGCEKVSEGCKFCYAELIAQKYAGNKAFPDGFGLTYRPHKLDEPIRRKKPTLYFVNSMSDFFWHKITDEYRHRMIDVMESAPQHEFQVLTKRPDKMLDFSRQRKLPPNFWAGVTIESGRVMPERLALLKQVDVEIRFVSFEPLIAPVSGLDMVGIQWAITGGESGTHLWKEKIAKRRALVFYDREEKKWKPRPERIDWVREIRDECNHASTHFFHKQWGGSYPEAAGRVLDGRTWNEIPRLPGGRTHIENNYLWKIEAEAKERGVETNY